MNQPGQRLRLEHDTLSVKRASEAKDAPGMHATGRSNKAPSDNRRFGRSVRKPVARARQRIVFVTTIAAWGGSEELWSRAAIDLVAQGLPVSASIVEGAPLHPRLRELAECGVELWPRPLWYSFSRHPWRRLTSGRRHPAAYALERLIHTGPPALVVFSAGTPFPPVELLELCATRNVPFAVIVQCNLDDAWPPDHLADCFRAMLAVARRCFFVSRANLRLAENQIGDIIANAEVVWNPVNLAPNISPAWPALGPNAEWRLACVGRLYPPQKGQDLLLEALAGPQWTARRWQLRFYGDGPMRRGIERLAHKLGLADRVVFAGYSTVEAIWAENHVLVMPSRFEGLPLAIVEAMLCARPVVATDVAGHAEIIEDGVTGFLAEAPRASAVASALERFWTRRTEAKEIGEAAARRIRQLLPPDPVQVFSDKLKDLAGLAEPRSMSDRRTSNGSSGEWQPSV
ncbi:MAG TPA: glycosyltransferase family 4 protein [Stellaceae bacterium]